MHMGPAPCSFFLGILLQCPRARKELHSTARLLCACSDSVAGFRSKWIVYDELDAGGLLPLPCV
jgi:hypothetical protein